ncbi:MAG: hypothetical protein ABEJ26_04460, partial [Halosimplex sp.]
MRPVIRPWFQTDPCGVEASGAGIENVGGPRFRRTLVGLKLVAVAGYTLADVRFRRTLVGSLFGRLAELAEHVDSDA